MPPQARACGSCTACCHSLVIEELDKPAFADCAHACPHGGCRNYHDRPASCRGFRCLWLDGHLTEDDRPDRLGVIFTTTHDDRVGVHPLVVEAWPGAATQPAVRDAVERLREKSPVLVLTAAGGAFHPRTRSGVSATTPLTVGGKAA
ncbi:MAG: hypothetical protein AAF710_02660 [Planctomycetota bacterium]